MGRGEDVRRRRGASPKTLIGPLVMLATGALTGVVAWRLLMQDGVGTPRRGEQLSVGDRHALDAYLHRHDARP